MTIEMKIQKKAYYYYYYNSSFVREKYVQRIGDSTVSALHYISQHYI